MKKSVFVAMVTIVSLIQSGSAQGQTVFLNPGEMLVPGSLTDSFGNPIAVVIPPPIRRPGDQLSPIDTGFQSGGFYVDPSTGQMIHRSDRFQRKDSAYDPNRHIVDPGSMQYIDEIQTDGNGVAWRVTGRVWSSFGQPHSELTRVRYQGNQGMLNRIQDQVETRDIQVVPQAHPVSHRPPKSNPRPMQTHQRRLSNVMDFFN